MDQPYPQRHVSRGLDGRPPEHKENARIGPTCAVPNGTARPSFKRPEQNRINPFSTTRPVARLTPGHVHVAHATWFSLSTAVVSKMSPRLRSNTEDSSGRERTRRPP